MKVNFNNFKSQKGLNFTGYEIKKDEYGEQYYAVNFPYDPKRYNCYWEAYPVTPDKNGDYDKNSFNKKYKNIYTGETSIKLTPGENKIYLDSDFGRIANTPFAYHFKLAPIDENGNDKQGAIPMYMADAGDLLDLRTPSDGEKIFNLVVPTGTGTENAGAAILVGADNFDVRYTYDDKGNIVPNPNTERDLNVYKNFANHVGGSLAGVHQALLDGYFDPYNRIFMLPHTSGDKTSAAGYWLESGFQFSSAVDNVDTFNKFQNDLFRKGKIMVADSALTSEGMSGIHIQSILRHGEDDVFFDWFKCDSLKNMTAKIGAFGAKTEYIRHKLINAPKIPVQNENGQVVWADNEEYKKDEPTFIQVYNEDFASEEQKNNPNLKIEKYGNPNGEHPLKYGTHNDIGITYNYQIKFDTYKDNMDRFNEYNRFLTKQGKPFVPLNSYMATRILTKFEGFEFENKIDGGFYTWDANVDIAKFDYADSNEDVEQAMNLPLDERQAYFAKKEQKRCEVLDYAVSSLKFWTNKTKQELNLYTAQQLKNINMTDSTKANSLMIEKISRDKLPSKINETVNSRVVENVINGDYILHGKDSKYNYHDEILNGLMNYPLESTEVGKDILALFSTPYITNRATKPEQVGKSRFELLQNGNPHLTEQYKKIYNLTTDMYSGSMYNFAKSVIDDVNNKLPENSKLNKNDLTTDYGKYVLPIITQEIAKFAVIKGLFPDVKYSINSDRGGISYDYKALNKKSLKALNIYDSSQKSEAEELVKLMRSGINKISEDDKKQLASAIYKMIEGTNLKSFEMAEMIVDRTKSGIDWRIDAAKDFSNMDSLRNDTDTFEDNWNRVIRVVRALSDGIKGVDPNRYIVAEITNEVDLYKLGEGTRSERFTWLKDEDPNHPYQYKNDIIKKLLREGKIDAVANYANYFTNIAAIFAKKGDDGGDWGETQDMRMYNIFKKSENGGEEEFLHSGPYDSIVKSYTFVDNHDKPRINHVLSLDMEFFFSNLTKTFEDIDRMGISEYDKNGLKYKLKEYRKRAYNVLNPDNEQNDYTEAVHNFDYTYVSPMATARGEALKGAFYKAINKIANQKDSRGKEFLSGNEKDEMYTKIKRVIAELASGKCGEVIFEPDNFGIEEVHKLIEQVIKEYSRQHGALNKEFSEALYANTFEQALKPALSNSLGIDKFLINSPGIPTIYAGDELGSSGFDKKTKNTHLKNRSAVHHEWVKKHKFIKDIQEAKENVTWLRSRPVLHALNDGAPFLLKVQNTYNANGDNGKYAPKVTALLRYASDGNAVISLFNVAGTTHTFDKYNDPNGNAVGISGNKIDLSYQGDFVGLHSGLEPNMEFINANDPNDKYYVFNEGGDDNYYLAKDKNCTQPIILKDNTLTLYHANDVLKMKDRKFVEKVQNRANRMGKEPPFRGRTYVNETYNVSPAKYSTPQPQPKTGSKLELVSK